MEMEFTANFEPFLSRELCLIQEAISLHPVCDKYPRV